MDWAAIDFETANADLSSICQVGIASFRDGGMHHSWESLVNPEDEFDPICVSIHGIDAEKVRSSPTWTEVYYSEVSPLLQANIVACHTAFDRVALWQQEVRVDPGNEVVGAADAQFRKHRDNSTARARHEV